MNQPKKTFSYIFSVLIVIITAIVVLVTWNFSTRGTVGGHVLSLGGPFHSENAYVVDQLFHSDCSNCAEINGTYDFFQYYVSKTGIRSIVIGNYPDATGAHIIFTDNPYTFYYSGMLGTNVGTIICTSGSTPRSCWRFPTPIVAILGYFVIAILIVFLFNKRKKEKKIIKNWISGLLNIIVPGFSHFYSNNPDRGIRIFANIASLILFRQIVILIIFLIGGDPTVFVVLYMIVIAIMLFITGINTTNKYNKSLSVEIS